MNKTININLGGFIFHIDELAYDKLKKYLEAIKNSLGSSNDETDEILKDIEARICELLNEKLSDNKQVVSDDDINEIIQIMGQPEDYTDGETAEKEENQKEDETESETYKISKKLFRDGEDRYIGGVASGTAHYLGIDITLARILWIFIAIFTGLGLFIYFMLWILTPEAKTSIEKLQMKGEPVNIGNIEKKIREEFENVSEKVKKGASDIENKFKNKTQYRLKNIVDTLVDLLVNMLKLAGKILGGLITTISFIAAFSLIAGLVGWISMSILGLHSYRIPHFETIIPFEIIGVCAIIFALIPFLLLLSLGLKTISIKNKTFSKQTQLILFALWVIVFIVLIFSGLEIGNIHINKTY